ncbi:MAG: pyruvoyl-dependent arginine decarboxylase [Halobacteriota archaeon]
MEKERLIPGAFFVTSGVGMDFEQAIAFDLALSNAGISECNLVEVSSILPADAVEIERSEVMLTAGEITFCVLSRADGKSGEVIGAGIGYGRIGIENEHGFGIICEHHGHYSREYLVAKISEKLYTMAETRIRGKKIEIEGKKLEVKSEEVEVGKFGSVVVALVFVF